jgi:hypothetical protein
VTYGVQAINSAPSAREQAWLELEKGKARTCKVNPITQTVESKPTTARQADEREEVKPSNSLPSGGLLEVQYVIGDPPAVCER